MEQRTHQPSAYLMLWTTEVLPSILLPLLPLLPLSLPCLLLLLLVLHCRSTANSISITHASSLRQHCLVLLLLLPLPCLAHLFQLLLLLSKKSQCCLVGFSVSSRHDARDRHGRP
jgi:O-antigen ligase